MVQSVLPTPDQEDDLTKLSEGTDNCYGAFIKAVEQITRANPNDITVHRTPGPEASESETEGDGPSPTKEESDSDTDSQHSTCWKRVKGKVTVPTSPQSVRMEENMDSTADGHDRSQCNIVEAQSPDPVADAIPVLEKLTAQLQTATKE